MLAISGTGSATTSNWIRTASRLRSFGCVRASAASKISITSCELNTMASIRRMKSSESALLEDNPQWYKDAVIYEVHVRAFCDGNGDGIGDFPGVTEKLDYLQDLGVTVLWLLPFYPSPLRDDGYDIADYRSIHPDYGSLRDFRLFVHEAHERGLKVVTELVVNHTSDQHPWFQAARRARMTSRKRHYYV